MGGKQTQIDVLETTLQFWHSDKEPRSWGDRDSVSRSCVKACVRLAFVWCYHREYVSTRDGVEAGCKEAPVIVQRLTLLRSFSIALA